MVEGGQEREFPDSCRKKLKRKVLRPGGTQPDRLVVKDRGLWSL